MKFLGSTTIYAYMQSCGFVNDHLVTCQKHAVCTRLCRSIVPAQFLKSIQKAREDVQACGYVAPDAGTGIVLPPNVGKVQAEGAQKAMTPRRAAAMKKPAGAMKRANSASLPKRLSIVMKTVKKSKGRATRTAMRRS
mmetsp:Transcript_3579/g.4440  ORF Transcript_3579/g.4440 Transcript_3579/m.4440 type:complete len:137 (+) Transcript_3579:3-413(+)